MLKAKITFYSLLANLISAGVPLDRALSRGMPRKLQSTGEQLRQCLLAGDSLGQAMARQRSVFSPLEIALIQVGEITGSLDRSATVLRDHFNGMKLLRSQLLSALAYPIFTYVMAIPLMAIAELATAQVGKGGLNFQGWGEAIAMKCLWGWGIPVLALVLAKCLAPNLLAAALTGRIINAIPLCGGVMHSYNSSIFWNTFGTCLNAGLTSIQAVTLSASACPSKFYQKKFLRLNDLLDGQCMTFAEAFENISSGRDERFQFTALAATGEATGRLDEAALRMGAQAEEATRTTLQRFAAVFPTVLFVCLALYLAFKIIGFYANYVNTLLSL